MVGVGLEVVQVDEAGVAVLGGPAGQAREQVALADARLAPEHGTDAAALSQRLTGQPGETLEGGAVQLSHIDVVVGRRVDAVIGKGVVREQPLPVPRGQTLPWAAGVGEQQGALVPILDLDALGDRIP